MLGFLSLGYVTGLICTSAPFSGQYVPACNKAMEALVVQTGVGQQVERVKQFYMDKAEREARKHVEVSREMMIVGGVAYTVVVKQELHVTFKGPISDSMSMRVNPTSASLGFVWRF